MSRSAHSQAGVKVRQLPKCSRCKLQFSLVMARYEDKDGKGINVEEWECSKCNKVVPKEFLKEEPLSEDEQFFHEKAKEIQNDRRKAKEQDSKRNLRNNLKK